MTSPPTDRLRVIGSQQGAERGEPALRPLRCGPAERPDPEEGVITRAELVDIAATVKRAHRMIEAALDRLCAG